MPNVSSSNVDYLECGHGASVILVHSSVSGARQWRRLMDDLENTFHIRAVNLFGYGKTPAWSSALRQTLDNQAALVEAIIPPHASQVMLVGHSFGGSVAMKAAARLGNRVTKLVLLEPNPFFLLRDNDRKDAFAEAMSLRDWIKTHGARGDWIVAAERFADYWGGTGTWAATSPERREAFAHALKPNFYEWDAVMGESTLLSTWSELLPEATLIVSDEGTVRPIREIVDLMRAAAANWHFEHISGGGHMAPLTRPDLVNPIITAFLSA